MAQNDEETPSWLSETPAPAPSPAAPVAAAAPSPAPVVEPQQTSRSATASSKDDQATMTADDEAALRGVIMFMRLANLGVSIAIILQASLKMVNFFQLPQYWVLGLYSLCGGCLICLLETQLSFIRTPIALNFGFLFNPVTRFVYYIFLATICAASQDLFGYICAGCLIGIALYNTFVLIRYPAYRKLRDQLAKEEDQRINAALRERVRKEAASATFGRK